MLSNQSLFTIESYIKDEKKKIFEKIENIWSA